MIDSCCPYLIYACLPRWLRTKVIRLLINNIILFKVSNYYCISHWTRDYFELTVNCIHQSVNWTSGFLINILFFYFEKSFFLGLLGFKLWTFSKQLKGINNNCANQLQCIGFGERITWYCTVCSWHSIEWSLITFNNQIAKLYYLKNNSNES